MIITNNKWNELFGGEFELIDSGFNDGQKNMDFDYERTLSCAKNETLPMLRLYGWDPWTVSLGFNQKEEDISLEKLKMKGFGLVRRPTGGRAVLHANELTYSVVLQIPEGKNAQDIYKEIHILLLEGLQKLEPSDLGFSKAQANFRDFYQKQPGISVSCFASTARYEIEFQGRKVVGSAQRVFGKTLLQHGSILLGKGHEEIADVTNFQDEEKREVLRKYILSHSATLTESCKREISFLECKDCVLGLFC